MNEGFIDEISHLGEFRGKYFKHFGRAVRKPAFGANGIHVGEFVRWLQSSLNQVLRINLPITGVMNAATRYALRWFQQRHGLVANGIAGPEVVRALVQAKKSSGGLTTLTQDRELTFPEFETADGLAKKLKVLSFLPHQVEVNGNDVWLKPAVMDPGIYDGPEKYKVSLTLQQALMKVMNAPKFRHMKIALVDLTRGAPQFAGFNHKTQVFIASVAKVAPMLAAFQLRQDLRAWLKKKRPTPKTLTEFFELMQDDWADTQYDHGGSSIPFTRGITLRGNIILNFGRPVDLKEPKAPRLDQVFKNVPAGSPVTIEFNRTGETFAQLQTIVHEFNQAMKQLWWAQSYLEGAKKKADPKLVAHATAIQKIKRKNVDSKATSIQALGFFERMGIMVGGDVPASNFATSTVVGDVGYHYIASTLLQSGLYDTNRSGGLWLGADYGFHPWRGALAGGVARSATAGSLAAFMTLLIQRKLVNPEASDEMHSLMRKVPSLTFPGTGSWFSEGLTKLQKVAQADWAPEVMS